MDLLIGYLKAFLLAMGGGGGWMGKSTYAIVARSKRMCAYDGGRGGVKSLLLCCVHTN